MFDTGNGKRDLPPRPPLFVRSRHEDELQQMDVVVGGWIRTRRLERGLTQSDLANAIKMPPDWIDLYERGVERILVAHLFRLADFLSVETRYFFEGL
jgi:ribosome-binding protein aMBF1 (putative translation factor)